MSDFATPKVHVRSGVNRILEGTKIGFWRGTTVLTAFSVAHQSGDGEREAVVKALSGRAWSWPWFDQLVVAFRQIGFWPREWEDMGIGPPPPWLAIPEETRSSLLALTFIAAVYVARDVANLTESARITGWKLTLVPGNENCPAERHFADLHKRAVERGKFDKVPPFFPGDTTQVRIRQQGKTGARKL